jgi:hypothetical protein
MSDDTKVEFSERLWSEEVAAADPTPEDKTAYVWSNGKKFEDGQGPYAPIA